jgi:acetate---CoA ligase (ADP-forming)
MFDTTSGVLADLERLRRNGVSVADEDTSKLLLATLGLASPPRRTAISVEACADAAEAVGFPVAVKIAGTDAAHKSDVGGVAGPLHTVESVRSKSAQLLEHTGVVMVEHWANDGVQCYVGLTLQSPLGPFLSVGLGGIWVEVLRDVAHALAPVTAAEAAALFRSLRGHCVIDGGRGTRPVDVAALASAVAGISQLAALPAARAIVKEVEINPILARPDGPTLALDCKVHLNRGMPQQRWPSVPSCQ